MTVVSDVRVRRHTDGRVAVCTELADGPYRWLVWPPYGRLTDEQVTGEGWCELLVAELPEPDGWADAVGDNGEDARTPYWETWRGAYTAWTDGVEDAAGLNEDLECLRIDALKMLAAVAACERYRAEAKP
jgi:hypothetical protein